MIGGFTINQKVFLFYFLKNFGFCLQPNTSDKDFGISKHQRLDGVAFICIESDLIRLRAVVHNIIAGQGWCGRLRYAHKKLNFACKIFFRNMFVCVQSSI